MNPTFVDLLAANADHADVFADRFGDLQDAQHPVAVSVCCSDSRVLQDHLWGNDRPGRVFTCGNIGNRVVQRTDAGEFISGDVLYPLSHTGTDLAVVVGHSGCGAVTATYDALTNGVDEPEGITYCLDLLKPHLRDGIDSLPADVDRPGAVNRLVEYNVDEQVAALVESDDVPPSVDVVGVVYDFQDVYAGKRGEVHVVNVDSDRDVAALREDHPEIAGRIDRLWEY